MDLVNDLSNDLAVAMFVDGSLKRKLEARDAKSFIAFVEQELERVSSASATPASAESSSPPSAEVSH